MPLPPERSSMIPTQQSKVMNRKARVVVERERGEDNDGDDDGGGTIDTTIKKCGR
jgi:hypothetical protein